MKLSDLTLVHVGAIGSWQMMFNGKYNKTFKHKCLNIGHKNTYEDYSIGGIEVTNSSYERDFGVIIDKCLNYNR